MNLIGNTFRNIVGKEKEDKKTQDEEIPDNISDEMGVMGIDPTPTGPIKGKTPRGAPTPDEPTPGGPTPDGPTPKERSPK